MAQQNKNEQQVDVNQLLKVRREKLADLQERGKDPFQITKYDVTNHTTEIKDNFEKFECEHDEEGKLVKDPAKLVSIAGRIMLKRVMGKASFCNVQDKTGNIQVYVARNELGDEPFEEYKDFKKMDIGDIVGVKGYPFVTKTGEKSIHATEVTLLSKSLQILPEKHHGLTNTDLRYRQRYLDLIMNPEVKETFIKRSKIISEIRKYLDGQGFMEVETPMLVHNAGGAAARPFETHFNALDEDVKLRISLELYLKRLIVGGLERVYEIGRVFRNEGVDTRHNPEFTLMELYQAYTDYHGMMDLTENLYRHLAEKVCGSAKIEYNGIEMDLSKPFERLTMVDAVKKYAGVDWNEVETVEQARELAAVISIINVLIGSNLFYSLNTVSRNVLMVSTVRMGIIRAEATFGHPVYYAMYCALIIPLALYMWQNERKRWNGCVLGLNIAAAFLTESRGTIVVLLALLLVFILITDKKTRNKILGAGCVIACLAVFVSFAVPTVSQQFTNIIKSVIIAFGDSGETIENFGGNSSTGLSSRMIQLSGISWMLIHNAVFGLGASCHTRGKLSYRINGIWQVRDTIDNGYVGYFVEEGLLGGIACFSLFYSLLKSSWKKATFKNSRNMNNSFFLCFVSYVAVMLSVADVSQLLWVIIALYITYNAKAQAIASE